MEKIYKLILLLFFYLLTGTNLSAQVSFTELNATYSQNFDGMGTSLTLPSNWRVVTTNAQFSWANGATSVTQEASAGSPTAGGTYNWGTTGGSDRAVGVMTSSGFISPNRYIIQLKNDGATTIDSFYVDFDVERYRRNSAAASVNFNYSTTGLGGSWQSINVATVTNANLPTGSSTYYFGTPSPIVERRNIKVPITVAPGATIYLAWPITNTGSSNAQGIGLDNVVIKAFYPVTLTPEVVVKGNSIEIQNGANSVSVLDDTDYGLACANSGSVSRNYSIENNGLANLNISNFTLSGSSDFSLVINPSSNIGINSSSIFQIKYEPQTLGVQTGTITFDTDDPLNPSFSFIVQGEVLSSLPPVSFLNDVVQPSGVQLNWNSPPLGCWDDALVVISDSPITFTPSGDGSSYTANNVYSGSGEQVVYKGFLNNVFISGLTINETYYAAAFSRKGTNWASPALNSFVFRDIIPDDGCNASVYKEFEIEVSDSVFISTLQLGLKIVHPQRSQLKVSLVAPNNTEVLLLNLAGGNGENINVRIDDEAAQTISSSNHTVNLAYEESVLPSGTGVGSLSAFTGLMSKGTWKVRVCDNASLNVGYIEDAEIFLTGCIQANSLAINGLSPSVRESEPLPSIEVNLKCNSIDFSQCNSGNITLSFTGCGLEGTLVSPVQVGKAIFDDLTVIRSLQSNVKLIATYSGSCATGQITQESNPFDIVEPLGPNAPFILHDETFEANSPIPWPYSVATTNAIVDVTGVISAGGNNFLRKTVTGNGTASITTITFDLVSNVGVYEDFELFFKVGSSVGIAGTVGNDANENFIVQVQRGGGAWTTALTHKGFGDKKFGFSASPITALTPSGNLETANTDTSSAFRVDIPGNTNSVRFRLVLNNNRSDESWCIDDIVLVGYGPGAGTPNSPLSLDANPIDLCLGESKTIDASVSNNNGTTAYAWTPATGLSNSTVLTPSVNVSSNQQYQLFAIDEDGCKDSINVDVNVNAVAQIDEQPQDLSACKSTFMTEVSASAPAYQWQYFDKSASNWISLGLGDVDFDGFDEQNLSIISNKSNYDSLGFRAIITENSLCPVTTDSVNYYFKPLIELPNTTGTYNLISPCEQEGWTYYSKPGNGGQYLFAINWAPDGTISTENANAKSSAAVTINVDDDYYGVEDLINGEPHATYTMRRYWNVDIANQELSEPVQVKFYYDENERQAILNAVNDFIALNPLSSDEGFKWFKTKTGPFEPQTRVQAINVIEAQQLNNLNTQAQTERGVLYARLNNISSFSGGTGAAGAGPLSTPLPVSLIYFTGTCTESATQLFWATASERNAKQFSIQRSSDAVSFETIGIIKASGNSSTPLNYTFLDANPLPNVIYYRLLQEDFDGTTETFKTITVSCGQQNPVVRAYYHPSEGVVTLVSNNKFSKMGVKLIDASGKIHYNSSTTFDAGFTKKTLDVGKLAKGFYVLQLEDGNNRYNEPFVVY